MRNRRRETDRGLVEFLEHVEKADSAWNHPCQPDAQEPVRDVCLGWDGLSCAALCCDGLGSADPSVAGKACLILQCPGNESLAVQRGRTILRTEGVTNISTCGLARPSAIIVILGVHRNRRMFTPEIQCIEGDVEIRIAVRFSQSLFDGVRPNPPECLESGVLRMLPLAHHFHDQIG